MSQTLAIEKVALAGTSSASVSKPSLRSDLIFNIGSQMFLRIVTAVTALYAARVLGPSSFGLWAMLQVIFMYTAQAHFGTVNAMLREVPIALTRGSRDEAQNLTNSTWSFVTICSVPIAVIAAVIVWWALRPIDKNELLMVSATGWLVFVQLQSGFFQFYCRGYGRFKLLAALSSAQAVLILPLCFYLIPKYGVAGYLFALSSGFTLITVAVVVRPNMALRLSAREWRHLLAIGLPMLPGGLMLYLNMSVERVALSVLGPAVVGIFVAGAFFFQIGGTIWELIAYTWYSRLATLYAQAASVDCLSNAFREIIPGALWVTSVLQGVAYIVMPMVLRLLLPEYTASGSVARILILTTNLWGIAQLLSISMGIIAQQKRAVVVQTAFLLVKLVCVCAAVTYLHDMLAVAVLSAGSVIVYVVLITSQWKRVSSSAIDSIWKWIALWSCPNGLAVVCCCAWGSERIFAVLTMYVMAMGLISLCLNRKSATFRGLYAWGAAR